MTTQPYRDFFKYILVGDSGVGKSHLIHTFANKSPPEKATCGLDSEIEYITLRNSRYKLHLWDAAGSERFRELPNQYYPKCDGVIVVYDITKTESFWNAQAWVQQIKEKANSNVCILLVGNKADLENLRQVTFEEAKNYANQNETLFVETSAQDADSVHEAFCTLTKSVQEKRPIFMPREKWVNDQHVSCCFSCNSAFYFYHWRYNCRKCGKVFHYQCSNYFVGPPRYNFEDEKKIRLCKNCYLILKEDEEEEEKTQEMGNSVQVLYHQIREDFVKARELAVESSLEYFLEAKAQVKVDEIKKNVKTQGEQDLKNQANFQKGTLAVRLFGNAVSHIPNSARSAANTSVQNLSSVVTWEIAAVVLVADCAHSFYKAIKGDITWKMFTKKVCISLGTASLCTVGGNLGAVVGGAIGTLVCPGIGTVIGSFLGGLVGGFSVGVSGTKVLESLANKYVDNSVEIKEINDARLRDIYLKSLKKFELNEDATDEDLKAKKKKYQLTCHPDKNPGQEERAAKEFIEYTTAYHIIMEYRKVHNL